MAEFLSLKEAESFVLMVAVCLFLQTEKFLCLQVVGTGWSFYYFLGGCWYFWVLLQVGKNFLWQDEKHLLGVGRKTFCLFLGGYSHLMVVDLGLGSCLFS